MVVRFDPGGRVEWQKALAVGDASYADGIAVSDSGVYVCGSARSGEKLEAFVAMLNLADGRTRWLKNYSFGSVTGARRLAVTRTGEIVFVGQTGNAENLDMVLCRLRSNGDTLWTRRYDSGRRDRPGDIVVDLFGNVVATGTAGEGAEARCVMLEYQPAGELIRATAYHEDVIAEGRAIATAADGELFVAGRMRVRDFWHLVVFQYLPKALSTWERNYGRPGTNTEGADLVVDEDAFVLGTFAANSEEKDLLVIRFRRPRS